MLLLKQNIEGILETAYEKIKPLLEPRNGLQHVLLLNDRINPLRTDKIYGDAEYTLCLNNILTNLQNEGYEIIDIKTASSCSSSLNLYFETLIIYK